MNTSFFESRKLIANNLILFIRLRGYSKLSLSKLTGISRPAIDDILKGENPDPTIYNAQIMQINQTFGLPAEYFLTFQNESVLTGPQKSSLVNELLDGLDNILDIYSMYLK